MAKPLAYKHSDLLQRTASIDSFRVDFGLELSEEEPSGPQISALSWLELRGTLQEPLANQKQVVIDVYPATELRTEYGKVSGIADLEQMKLHLHLRARCPEAYFDHVWSMALAGFLKFAHLRVTPVRYRKAQVIHLSFSNEAVFNG